jgi:hypothetical protein
MPTVYRFRISFEDYDDVYRDIEIRSNQTFEDLHYIIQSAINFDATKPASFIMSNDYWIKGQEISLQARTDKEGKSLPLMAESKLSDFIADPHQKIIYLSDYEAGWNLHIELIKLLPHADEKRNYPVCVKSSGDAPRQYPVVNIPKPIPAVEDDLSALLLADGLLSVLNETEEAEEIPEKENLMEEAEDGVELDEIEGMNEEGEEEEKSEEESEEMGFGDGDEEVQDDQY